MARNNYRNNRNKNEPPSAPNARRRGTSRARRRSLKNPFTKPGSQQTFVPGSEDTSGNPMWYYEDYIDGYGGSPGGPSNPGQPGGPCLNSCVWTNNSAHLYECVNPAGSTCNGQGVGPTYTNSNCNNACGSGCPCVYIGQSGSGGQYGWSWVAHYGFGACIGPGGCCVPQSTSNPGGSCSCTTCTG
tara:strand:- start:135 stop:692 length:558 start_codon:yes stop_codon:yes gene_type:complete